MSHATYRCKKCGYERLGDSKSPPVIQFRCDFDGRTEHVRDLNEEELIELHALLAERRALRLAAP